MDDLRREWLTLPRLLLPGLEVVGVAGGVGGVFRAATSYHSSTLKTMCATTDSRCTSCEQGHESIALTAWMVWRLRSRMAGTLEGMGEVASLPMVLGLVEKIVGSGNSCFISACACARQVHRASVMIWSLPRSLRVLGFLAGGEGGGV